MTDNAGNKEYLFFISSAVRFNNSFDREVHVEEDYDFTTSDVLVTASALTDDADADITYALTSNPDNLVQH